LCTPDEENVIEFIIYPMGRSQTCRRQNETANVMAAPVSYGQSLQQVLICAILKTARGGLAMRRLTTFEADKPSHTLACPATLEEEICVWL
jgi:hypothetical protein